MFFNYWVGFLNETYLFLAVCASLNLFYLRWSAYGDALNSSIALFFGILILAFPLFIAVHYNLPNNYKKITQRDEDFLARYGNILNDLNLKRRGRIVFIPVIASFIRKLWLIYMIVF